MEPRDNEVLAQFGEDLDELCSSDGRCRCGGAEAQSLIRRRLHDAYDGMTPEMREAVRTHYGDHSAIKGKRISFWDNPEDHPHATNVTAPAF